MGMEPAAPGERIKPKMTAEWYNQTLPQRKERKGGGPLQQQPDIECYLATGTIPRFSPVGVEDFLDPTYMTHGVKINNTPTSENWGVVQQEIGVSGKTGNIVLFGLTFAIVASGGDGHRVDLVDSELKRCSSGKALLIKYGEPYSLIVIDGGGDVKFRFELVGSLALGTALADIYKMDGITLVQSNAELRISMEAFTSLGVGGSGWCWGQDGVYYVGNANCADGS